MSGNSFEASLTRQSPQSRRNPVSDSVNGSNDLRGVRAQGPRHGYESCNLPAQFAQLFGNAGAVYFTFSTNLSLMQHIGIIDLGPVQPRATVNKPATMPEGQRGMWRKKLLHRSAREVGGYEAVLSLEPGVTKRAGPYSTFHKVLDPGVVLFMCFFGDLKGFDLFVKLHPKKLSNVLRLYFTEEKQSHTGQSSV